MKSYSNILIVAALVLGGCDRDEEQVRVYTAPKDAQQSAAPAQQNEPGIEWTLPAGWQPIQPSGSMIYAAFQITQDAAPVTLTVTPLGPEARPLLPNLNRWEQQLGLKPSSEADAKKLVTSLKINGQDSEIVDLLGPNPAPEGKPQQRMLAAIVPGGGRVWFFKAIGPADKVGAQKPAFEGFVKSVKFTSGGSPQQAQQSPQATGQPMGQQQLPPSHPPIPSSTPGASGAPASTTIPGIASYTLPEGWVLAPTQPGMRLATIVVNDRAELAISRLGRNAFGDPLSNLNRWRGTVKLPPTNDINAHPAKTVQAAQGPISIMDFEGPEGADRMRLRVARTDFPDSPQTFFFRLLGPHDVVTKNKPAFETFVKSLKFE